MDTPLGGKGWGPYLLLLQCMLSLPGYNAKGGCKIAHHHGPEAPPALPIPAHASPVYPHPAHNPGPHFSPPGLSVPAPATPHASGLDSMPHHGSHKAGSTFRPMF